MKKDEKLQPEETKEEKVVEESKNSKKKKEALVTCRVLFISVLDKIYLIILALMLISATYNNFAGDISSVSYGFFGRVGKEILSLLGLVVVYFFYNWLYKCVAKTMLCVTETEVYKEKYLPFKRGEISIPLNKITAVSTINVFWIFRSVVIHQYGRLPMIFFTWNNQEFKDKVNELINKRKEEIQNDFKEKNLVNNYNILKYVGIVLAGIILLVGIVRFFNYVFSAEKKIAGSYTNGDYKIVLVKNGSCELEGIRDKIVSCEWNYNKDLKKVYLNYKYEYGYYSSYSTTLSGDLVLDYNESDKTLTYGNFVYKK